RKVVIVTVPASEKGIAIGKDGKNISRARILAKRYFDVDWVTIV
ncbi:MAG TPA: NusA-like transcription termination signal-binding factor, partial [Thermoprotei archaeon]|nr:NusA-like transcription termination signal-binding factor [Thermoprotei archaeon]